MRTPRGFTLIELLIVMSIILLMAAATAPAFLAMHRSVQLRTAANLLLEHSQQLPLTAFAGTQRSGSNRTESAFLYVHREHGAIAAFVRPYLREGMAIEQRDIILTPTTEGNAWRLRDMASTVEELPITPLFLPEGVIIESILVDGREQEHLLLYTPPFQRTMHSIGSHPQPRTEIQLRLRAGNATRTISLLPSSGRSYLLPPQP